MDPPPTPYLPSILRMLLYIHHRQPSFLARSTAGLCLVAPFIQWAFLSLLNGTSMFADEWYPSIFAQFSEVTALRTCSNEGRTYPVTICEHQKPSELSESIVCHCHLPLGFRKSSNSHVASSYSPW